MYLGGHVSGGPNQSTGFGLPPPLDFADGWSSLSPLPDSPNSSLASSRPTAASLLLSGPPFLPPFPSSDKNRTPEPEPPTLRETTAGADASDWDCND